MKVKKIIVLLTTMCMLCGLVACGGDDNTNVSTNDDQTVTEDNGSSDKTEEDDKSGSYDEITEEVVRNHAVTDASDFEYEKNETTGEITITDYIGKDAIVVFPEEIDGCPVTEISNFFFANDEYTHVRGVLIPTCIKEIYNTFVNNSTIEVVILEGIEILGECSCFNCASLNTVILPETLKEIQEYGISNCPNIHEIVIPDSVENIDEFAFVPYDTTIKGKSGGYAQTYYETYWQPVEEIYRCKFEAVD